MMRLPNSLNPTKSVDFAGAEFPAKSSIWLGESLFAIALAQSLPVIHKSLRH
jgi:hypothetical protein